MADKLNFRKNKIYYFATTTGSFIGKVQDVDEGKWVQLKEAGFVVEGQDKKYLVELLTSSVKKKSHFLGDVILNLDQTCFICEMPIGE